MSTYIKVSELPEALTMASTDIFPISANISTTPISKFITLDNLLDVLKINWLFASYNYGNVSGAVTIDAENGHRQKITMVGDMTSSLAIDNLTGYPQIVLEIVDGGFTVDFSEYFTMGDIPSGHYLAIFGVLCSGYKFVSFSTEIVEATDESSSSSSSEGE